MPNRLPPIKEFNSPSRIVRTSPVHITNPKFRLVLIIQNLFKIINIFCFFNIDLPHIQLHQNFMKLFQLALNNHH